MSRAPRVQLIYTGGTIGMMSDARSGVLRAMDLDNLADQVPELVRMGVELSSVAFERPIDSSDMRPADWLRIARMVEAGYADHDGFVVLHGSDTMAYTASALSFMLEGLAKPVVLTGSQLPLNTIRTDGKENLLTAIEVAAARLDGRPRVPEVAVLFDADLYRGNRSTKVHAEHFNAFASPNWPVLAAAGVHIRYDQGATLPIPQGPLRVHAELDDRVAVLPIFPGIRSDLVRHCLAAPKLQAAVLLTLGSGNAPTDKAFLDALREAHDRGITLVNVTQCGGGRVDQGRYETSSALTAIGVVGGSDLTLEAAVTKLMHLRGRGLREADLATAMGISLRGEMSV